MIRRFRRQTAAMIALGVLVACALLGAAADVVAPYPPSQQFLAASGPSSTPASGTRDPLAERATGKYESPSRAHVFGTDHLARDIFSRTLHGLRISLIAASVTVVVVVIVGLGAGMAAAAGPRWLDALLMRTTDVAYAFPELLLAILLRAALGERATILGVRSILGVEVGAWVVFGVIAATAWPTLARLTRGQMLAVRERDFTLAAVALGVPRWRIALRHWLPNALAPLIVEATFVAPRAIFAEATLSFLGIGVTPPTPSLGVLIADHFGFVMVQWTALAIPVALLTVLFVAFQLVGDGLRAALDPRGAPLR